MDRPFNLDIRIIFSKLKKYKVYIFYYKIYNIIWYVYIVPHNSLEIHAQD